MRRPFPFIRSVFEQYRERLTPRGRYVLWLTAALAMMGLDTRGSQVFKVFAVSAAILVVAALFALARPPRVELSCRLPLRMTAGQSLEIPMRVSAAAEGLLRPLLVSFPRPRRWGNNVSVEPRQSVVVLGEADPVSSSVSVCIEKRGRYVIPAPTVRATDPLGLVAGSAKVLADEVLLVYPRFYAMESFQLPLGRRYQPGGIPLASHTGDSLEFLGTREYQPGDPLRRIHWRSWARLGKPVVMEFQEEYFSRIALILDTFVPKTADVEAFEASISVVASVADFFSRSDYIVDIFAAGPDIYEVSAGRSLAYLENILDVLACLEPCSEPAFEVVGPALFEKLGQITSVVAVVQDWDRPRAEFLRRVKAMGVELRIIIIRDAPTQEDWRAESDSLGDMSLLRPRDVERALTSEVA